MSRVEVSAAGAGALPAAASLPPAARSAATPGAVSWPRRLAYGALGLPLAMAALPIYVHAPRLWSESTGMSLALLGGVLLAMRLLDAAIDPLLGAWSDAAAKRQRLIVVALPFLAAGFFALLHPPLALTPPLALGWLLAALLSTYFGFSLANIAYQAWGAEIGADARERTRLVACREGFGLIGVVLAAALPGLLAAGSSAALADGLSALAWIYPPLLAMLAAVAIVGAPPTLRLPTPVSSGSARAATIASTLAGLRAPLADARFRTLLAVFVVNGIAAALPATLVLFFVADVLHAETYAGAFLALYFVAGVAFLPLWVALARRFGRVRSWVLAMATACVAFAAAAGLGAGDVWPFALVCVFSGAALGADLTLPAALLADAAAEAPAAGGGAGAYFGWWNLVAKLNLALAAGLALPLLDLSGYRPGVAAADGGALFGLVALYCGLPIVFKTVAAILAWRWRHLLEPRS